MPVTVDLAQMLAAREDRVRRQQVLQASSGLPLISLTLVSPGPHKDSPTLREVMQIALAALDACLAVQSWPVLAREIHWLPTGPEALYTTHAEPLALKRVLVALEDQHPLGRLWDIDVIDSGSPLSRRALQLPVRQCLVCDEPAHACARAQRHPLPQLLATIEERISAFQRAQRITS